MTVESVELPRRQVVRNGVALCLSGGGFRAALYHLGALRRLNELGLLGHLDTISCVSGGSILGAFLARQLAPWPVAGVPCVDWETRIAAPFREFCEHDLRTPAFLRALVNPFRLFLHGLASSSLERQYRKRLHSGSLAELPARPNVVFCATEMVTGTLWRFDRERVGSYDPGPRATRPSDTIAHAVAASSCFPPVFAPIRAGKRRNNAADAGEPVPDPELTDGGVYDNLGLEPVIKNHAVLLISDGGAPFDKARARSLIATVKRLPSLLMRQIAALRRRQYGKLKDDREIAGAFWDIDDVVDDAATGAGGQYSTAFVSDVVAAVRTDLDHFAPVEARVLENHGYWCAAEKLGKEGALLQKFGARAVEPAAPHPDLGDEASLRCAMAAARRGFLAAVVRAILGRA